MNEPRLSDDGERLNLTIDMQYGGRLFVSAQPASDRDVVLVSATAGDLYSTFALDADAAGHLGAHLLHLSRVAKAAV